jgi:mannose-6-phosphate isomerase
MKAYPLKFKTIFKPRIWGGQRLRELFGKDIPVGEKIGESWELADLPEDKSIIVNGELAGKTLAAAVEQYAEQITGERNFSLPFPLLIKFLDAEDVLSVQVHPDSETCRRMGKGDPKTECWYILSAAPGAVLYKGLKKGVTRDAFAGAVQAGTAADLLEKVPVEPGQCHFLPAGTAHSIGAGIMVAEVQTPSDTTYRVFDWNRVDRTGKGRELHIEEALESIHFDVSGLDLPVTTVGRLVQSRHFTIDKGHRGKGCEVLLSRPKMKALIFISGCGVIEGGTSDSVEFRAGDCLLIPATYEGAAFFQADSEYLTVTL